MAVQFMDLWPPQALQLNPNDKLNHYDVFVSFAGRGTMKGLANAFETTLQQTHALPRVSVFNEDIQQRIDTEIKKGLHATHNGVGVLLLNKAYVAKKWPMSEARVLVAMYLAGKISLVPVIVLPKYDDKAADDIFYNEFVKSLGLKPEFINKVESLKYHKLEAPQCATSGDAEADAIPVERLEMDAVRFGEIAREVSDIVRSNVSHPEILGRSREETFFNMIDKISKDDRVMRNPTLNMRLGVPISVPKDAVFANALEKKTITQTNVGKLESLCDSHDELNTMLKQYKKKFLNLTPVQGKKYFVD